MPSGESATPPKREAGLSRARILKLNHQTLCHGIAARHVSFLRGGIEGRIGDQTHLKFILDTGATISMVGQRVAEKLKLDAHTAQSYGLPWAIQRMCRI